MGISLPEGAEGVKEHLGYMSQKFNLYGDLTVDENIAFFADVFLIDRATLEQRLAPLLHMTRLAPFRRRLARDLSGGMKQKLALICTLIHRPTLLLLDEPTAGVDPVSRREFWEMLHDIRREGVTIVISTPYMDEAEWCMRVGLMFRGKFISCDTPKKLKESLSGVVVEIMPSRPGEDISGVLRGSEAISDLQVLGDVFHAVMRTDADAVRLAAVLDARALVRRIPASIEDVFVSKIKD